MVDIDESQLFIFRKKEKNLSWKNMLVTMDNPGAYNAIKPVIHALTSDERCGDIVAVVSGIAGKNFSIDFRGQFTSAIKSKSLFMKEIAAAFGNTSVILCSVSEANGPEGVMLYAGKSVFGAEKLYMICDGWGTLGSAFGRNRKNMDTVDGFFCNDALAKTIIEHHVPEISRERVHAIGTPVVETIEVEKADRYRQSMRKRFCLDEDVHALLFLGDISDGYKKTFGSDPKINEITFEKTVIEMMTVAEAHPDKKFALLLRPHPRDANKQELYAIMKRTRLPRNLIFADASVDIVSMNEVAYGADVIASIASTENLLAPLRGRRAVYLGYQDSGLGGELLERVYGKEILNLLSCAQGISVVSSPEEFGSVFLQTCSSHSSQKNIAQNTKGNSVERILDIIFKEVST